MKVTTPPTPTSVAMPPGPPNSAATAAIAAYKSLAQVDPGLIPEPAARIARASHRYSRLRPAPGQALDDATAQWRAAVDTAVHDDSADPALPDLDDLAHALAIKDAGDHSAGLLRSMWDAEINGLGRALAAGGDQIVAGLRAIHDQAWERFTLHSAAIADVKSEAGILARGDEAAHHFREAGSALTTFANARAARTRLHGIKQYAADVPSEAHTVFRDPGKVRSVRLPRETLQRWAVIATEWPAAEPVIMTRDEASAWHREQEAAAKQGVPA